MRSHSLLLHSEVSENGDSIVFNSILSVCRSCLKRKRCLTIPGLNFSHGRNAIIVDLQETYNGLKHIELKETRESGFSPAVTFKVFKKGEEGLAKAVLI